MTDTRSIASFVPSGSATPDTVHTAIARASSASGVDFGYLLGQARIESGLDPAARAKTSSATGLYQFTRQTWLATLKRHGAEHGFGWASDAISQTSDGRYHVSDPAQRSAILDLRTDPGAAAAMAAAFAGDNGAYLTQRLGHAPQSVDLYLAHFLGAAGAGRFLEAYEAAPDAPAAALFPAAAAANRAVFYDRSGNARSLGAIRDHFAAKLGRDDQMLPPPNPGFGQPAMVFAVPQSMPLSPPIPTPTPTGTPPREYPPMMAMLCTMAMPSRLSISFARASYQRLDAMSAGRGA